MSQSVDRALTILLACAGGAQRLGGLADALGVHRSTVLRILQTLEERKFVRRKDDGSWVLGLGFTGAALSALDAMETRVAAAPWLRRLAGELGHTFHLAELSGTEVNYVDKVEGRGAVRMNSRIGATVQLNTAALAKVIIANATESVRSSLMATMSYPRFTGTTLTSAAVYQRELDMVREQGWAVDNGEFEDYISCIAVPIRGHEGTVHASISMTALKAIEPLDQLKLNLPRLAQVALEISKDLGWDSQKGRTND